MRTRRASSLRPRDPSRTSSCLRWRPRRASASPPLPVAVDRWLAVVAERWTNLPEMNAGSRIRRFVTFDLTSMMFRLARKRDLMMKRQKQKESQSKARESCSLISNAYLVKVRRLSFSPSSSPQLARRRMDSLLRRGVHRMVGWLTHSLSRVMLCCWRCVR